MRAGHQPFQHRRRGSRRQQRRRGRRGQPTEPEDGHALRELGRYVAGAGRQDERDGIGAQPARGEGDGGRRLAVQPVQVVDEHQDRPAFGGAASNESVAAATRNRSAADDAGDQPSADRSASACDSGTSGTRSRIGCNSSSSPAWASWDSDSAPCAVRQVKPSASERAAPSSVVLPTPGSPSTSNAVHRPAAPRPAARGGAPAPAPAPPPRSQV